VRRYTHRQPLSLARAFCQGALRHLRHAVIGSGNHDLRFGVQVSNIGSCPLKQVFHLGQGQPHNRRQAVAVRVCLLHQIAAQRHQLQRVRKVQRTGDNRRRISANGQPADDIRRHAATFQLARPRHAGNQQRKLNRTGVG